MTYPWEQPPILEKHDSVWVVRDDLIEGGSKVRFLPYLVNGAKEVVYGGPCQGAAAVALSVIGREKKTRVTLFYAQRKTLLSRQAHARTNGAIIKGVPLGYITNVQKKARDYAQKNGALFLELGFDMPKAEAPFMAVMQQVRKRVGDVEQVWCATSTGMMARCLGKVFINSQIVGVTVGASRWHSKQDFPSNVILVPSGYKDLSEPVKRLVVPFPCCPNYEQKAWKLLNLAQARRGSFPALFWNVIGLQ